MRPSSVSSSGVRVVSIVSSIADPHVAFPCMVDGGWWMMDDDAFVGMFTSAQFNVVDLTWLEWLNWNGIQWNANLNWNRIDLYRLLLAADKKVDVICAAWAQWRVEHTSSFRISTFNNSRVRELTTVLVLVLLLNIDAPLGRREGRGLLLEVSWWGPLYGWSYCIVSVWTLNVFGTVST